jgi:hypothetical protein
MFRLSLVTVILGESFFALPNAYSQTANEPVPDNGLRMSIAHDETATGPYRAMHFIVTFSNLTSGDLSVTPGTLVNCGTKPSKTSAVRLNLTDSTGIAHKQISYVGSGPPYVGGCAGAIVPFTAVLHGRESLSLPLHLGEYFDLSDSKEYEQKRFAAGTYILQAELTVVSPPTVDAVKAWTGKVTSNAVTVRFDSEFAGPFDYHPLIADPPPAKRNTSSTSNAAKPMA